MMLVSDWLKEWDMFTHSAVEHEVPTVDIHSAHYGPHEIVVLHLEREDGQHATIRMRKEEARSLALQIRNLWPTVYGDH